MPGSGDAKFRGRWTVTEDELLMQLVAEHGNKNWRFIATHLPGRLAKQCRERWFNQLDPSVRRESLSEAEWKLLLEAHSKYGNHWAEIVKSGMIPGRTANQLKNHWNTRVRRRMTDQSRKRNRAAALAASTANARASPSHVSSEHHSSSEDAENSLDDDDTIEAGDEPNKPRNRASIKGRTQIPSAASVGLSVSMSKSSDGLSTPSSSPFLGDLEALTAVATKHADSNTSTDLTANGFGSSPGPSFGHTNDLDLQNQLTWQQHQQALVAQQLQMQQSMANNPQFNALARQQQLQQQLLFQQQQQQQQQQTQALLQSGMNLTEIQQHMQLQALLQFQQQQQMLGLLGLSPTGLISPLMGMQSSPLSNSMTSLGASSTSMQLPNLLAATSNAHFLPSPLANSSSTASTSSPVPPAIMEPNTPEKAEVTSEAPAEARNGVPSEASNEAPTEAPDEAPNETPNEAPNDAPIEAKVDSLNKTAMDVSEVPRETNNVSPKPVEPTAAPIFEENGATPSSDSVSSPA